MASQRTSKEDKLPRERLVPLTAHVKHGKRKTKPCLIPCSTRGHQGSSGAVDGGAQRASCFLSPPRPAVPALQPKEAYHEGGTAKFGRHTGELVGNVWQRGAGQDTVLHYCGDLWTAEWPGQVYWCHMVQYTTPSFQLVTACVEMQAFDLAKTCCGSWSCPSVSRAV